MRTGLSIAVVVLVCGCSLLRHEVDRRIERKAEPVAREVVEDVVQDFVMGVFDRFWPLAAGAIASVFGVHGMMKHRAAKKIEENGDGKADNGRQKTHQA